MPARQLEQPARTHPRRTSDATHQSTRLPSPRGWPRRARPGLLLGPRRTAGLARRPDPCRPTPADRRGRRRHVRSRRGLRARPGRARRDGPGSPRPRWRAGAEPALAFRPRTLGRGGRRPHSPGARTDPRIRSPLRTGTGPLLPTNRILPPGPKRAAGTVVPALLSFRTPGLREDPTRKRPLACRLRRGAGRTCDHGIACNRHRCREHGPNHLRRRPGLRVGPGAGDRAGASSFQHPLLPGSFVSEEGGDERRLPLSERHARLRPLPHAVLGGSRPERLGNDRLARRTLAPHLGRSRTRRRPAHVRARRPRKRT